MPFFTACPFCPARMKVPDQWLGTSLRCPKCGSNFTVAPAEEAPAKESARPAAKAAPPAGGEVPWWVSASQGVSAEPTPPEPPAPVPVVPAVIPEPLFSPATPPAPYEQSGWVNTWGALSLFVAGLGLLLAGSAFPRWLTVTLAVLGLLAGVVGAVAARGSWQVRDGAWLSVGGGANGVLLLVALFLPSWLNAEWGMDFYVPEPDLNKQLLVSRDNRNVVRELTGDEWVDAEKNAVRQGDVLIRVEGAAVERPPGSDQPVLLVTLHVANVGPLHTVTYHGQGGSQHPAALRDDRGKELPRRDLGAQARKAGQVKTVSVLPLHDVKDVVASAAPSPGSGRVDLELSAAAWGREGVCKFRIPRTMIVHRGRHK